MSELYADKNNLREITVGVLAFQGAYEAHSRVIESLGAKVIEIRTRDEFQNCTHLILPGGESTTFLKLLEFHDLTDALRIHAEADKPILATCAGLILLASDVSNPPQETLGILDITIERNAYGRQVDSFETELEIPIIGTEKFHGIFIRAPKILSVGENVKELALFDGHPVLVRQGVIFGATFHPELSGDKRLHELFLNAGNDATVKY